MPPKKEFKDCEKWPEIKQGILEGCKNEGWITTNVMVYLKDMADIGRTVYANWMEYEPEFLEVIQHGKLLSELWWLNFAKENMNKRNWQASTYRLIMQNSFSWSSEKIDVDGRINAVKAEVDAETEDQKLDYIFGLLNPK